MLETKEWSYLNAGNLSSACKLWLCHHVLRLPFFGCWCSVLAVLSFCAGRMLESSVILFVPSNLARLEDWLSAQVPLDVWCVYALLLSQLDRILLSEFSRGCMGSSPAKFVVFHMKCRALNSFTQILKECSRSLTGCFCLWIHWITVLFLRLYIMLHFQKIS